MKNWIEGMLREAKIVMQIYRGKAFGFGSNVMCFFFLFSFFDCDRTDYKNGDETVLGICGIEASQYSGKGRYRHRKR